MTTVLSPGSIPNNHNNNNQPQSSSSPSPSPSYTILWSTQGGRAKACARRTARILRDAISEPSSSSATTNNDMMVGAGYYGSSFDDYGALEVLELSRRRRSSREEGDDDNDDGVKLVILFVSTTGDAEHCDSIRDTWKALLQRSLPKTQFQSLKFALFCLGDRAYGPNAFCAAGRKLAARLVQLGASPYCNVGYGDDGTPNGGVFRDLDTWLEEEFLIRVLGDGIGSTSGGGGDGSAVKRRLGGEGSGRRKKGSRAVVTIPQSPYQVGVSKEQGNSSKAKNSNSNSNSNNTKEQNEWQKQSYRNAYNKFFESQCPATAYRYCPDRGTRIDDTNPDGGDGDDGPVRDPPLLGCITSNTRLTAKEWVQDTRHIGIHIRTRPANVIQTRKKSTNTNTKERSTTNKNRSTNLPPPLPYAAGDIATILPSNSKSSVTKFISYLPPSLQRIADTPISITTLLTSSTQYATSFTPWPQTATLRGILTYCADIASLPEREDLRALSVYCHPKHPMGRDQRSKLISLSETEDAQLYGDYVIREKRDWCAVLFDFDSVRFESEEGGDGIDISGDDSDGDGSGGNDMQVTPLTIEHLLLLLPPIMPRHFSIASAPSNAIVQGHEHGYTHRDGSQFGGFDLELCVAIVEGETRHKRKFSGLCSGYLSHLKPSVEQNIRVWIRPGSFGKLPMDIVASDVDGVGGGGEEKSSSARRSHHFETPIMCIGAGTGVAPLRSLLHERESIFTLETQTNDDDNDNGRFQPTLSNTTDSMPQETTPTATTNLDNVLVFGCRKSTTDYYYKSEWEDMQNKNRLRLLTAFSQDQKHKIYVQRLAREADSGYLIAKHIVENSGAVYVAGGAKMARAVREEIVECLGKVLPGGERDAKLLIKKLQRIGKFSVEAWS